MTQDPFIRPTFGFDFASLEMPKPSIDMSEDENFLEFIDKHKITDGDKIFLSDGEDRCLTTVKMPPDGPLSVTPHWAMMEQIAVTIEVREVE